MRLKSRMHGILHVRICGGPGRVTARVYPTPMAPMKVM